MSHIMKLFLSEIVWISLKFIKEMSSILSDNDNIMVIFREPALKRVKFCAIVEMCIVFDAIPWWHDTPRLSVDVVLDALLSKVKLNAFL